MTDERTLFERAMRGIEPLERQRERVVGRERPRPDSRPRPRLRREGFRVTRYGAHVEGLAAGVDDETLRRLRALDPPVERKVDLHGLGAEEARLMVRDVLATAWKTGQRCLLLVHGRGRNSPGGAVLKEALPGWLEEAPHGRRVLAFTTASRVGGGGGATLVLLRRR